MCNKSTNNKLVKLKARKNKKPWVLMRDTRNAIPSLDHTLILIAHMCYRETDQIKQIVPKPLANRIWHMHINNKKMKPLSLKSSIFAGAILY